MHRSTSTARGARHVVSGEAHPFRLRTRCRVSPAAANKTEITVPMRARVPIPARPIGAPHTAIMGDAVAIATSPIFEGSVNYPANNEISVPEHRRAVNYPPAFAGGFPAVVLSPLGASPQDLRHVPRLHVQTV